MARSIKKKGRIKEGGQPAGKSFGSKVPDDFSDKRISWRFSQCDTDPGCRWSFNPNRFGDAVWDMIIRKLREFEGMTPAEIFVNANYQNHSIDVNGLLDEAGERLASLHIEAESLYSLRLSGTKRLYGILDGAVYSVIWYDDDHGDNDRCVCRSRKKHT